MAKLQLNNNIDIDLDHYTTELEQNISDLNVIQNNLNSLIYNQMDILLQIEDNMSNTKEDILVSNVNLKKVNIYRWEPSNDQNPRIDTFEVDMNNCGPKVLDILFKIKNEIDSSLTFRRSCAHGVCGSCAMNVDGVNTLSCIKSHTDIEGELNIYPLPHLKVIKDLIGDLTGLYKQYESIQPWLKTSQTGQEKQEILQSEKDR